MRLFVICVLPWVAACASTLRGGNALVRAADWFAEPSSDDDLKPSDSDGSDGLVAVWQEEPDLNPAGPDVEPELNPAAGDGKPDNNVVKKPVHGHKWTYEEPTMWGDEYDKCSGGHQSPVDFDVTNFVVGEKAARTALIDHIEYKPMTGRKLMNGGHNEQVNGDFGVLKLPDGNYHVRQFHFHFPSEHAINGQLAAGEIHIVHQRDNATGTNALAVIGILLQRADAIVGYDEAGRKKEVDFIANLGFGKELPDEGHDLGVKGEVDLNVFAHELSGPFFHYYGSLTTPPCSETVHWYVLERPAVVTDAEIQSFIKRFPAPGNNRPVQKLNERHASYSELAFPGEFEQAKLQEAAQMEAKAEEKAAKKEDKAQAAKSEATAAEAKEVMQGAKVAVKDAEHVAAKSAQVAAEAAGDKAEAKEAKKEAAEIKEKLKKEKKELKEVTKAADKAQKVADKAKGKANKAEDAAEEMEQHANATKAEAAAAGIAPAKL